MKSDELAADLVRSVAKFGPLHSIILELWQRLRMDWSSAGLSAGLRQQSQLRSRERRFVGEVIFGLVRNLRRIDASLVAGGVRGGTHARDELRLCAYLILVAGLPVGELGGQHDEVDWSAVLEFDRGLANANPRRQVTLAASLPDWLADRLLAEHEDAPALARALNQRAPLSIRANLLVNSVAELAAELAAESVDTRPSAVTETGLVATSHPNLAATKSYRRGGCEAQDEGSQLIAELVAPPPRSLVVDFCAGAGGKTLALAAALANRGRIIAADPDARKLGELRRRVRRARVTNVQQVTVEGDHLPTALEAVAGKVDRVLVDVPCTGVGSLRRHPELRFRLTEQEVRDLPGRQLAIADKVVPLLARGGRLIYATCTVLDSENRAVVSKLLARHPELEPVAIGEILGAERAAAVADGSGQFLELFPHRHGTDGFFAAVLQRS